MEPIHAPPRLIGPYLLHAQLAAGGMGTGHLGVEVATGRPVAIKRLRAELALNPDFLAMFLDEARLTMLVRHPNVVTTLGVLEDAGELFLALEYVAGASLSSALAAGPVPPSVASRIALDVLAGLTAAHGARDEHGRPLDLVHRDVSPHNVLIGSDGVARLADFGIARAAGRLQLSTPGQLKGKLRYIAPELLRGGSATPRSDVYGATVVLWEALTGARLFHGTSYAQLFGEVLEGIVTPPHELAPISPAASDAVLRGLARDPERRFATANAMANALVAALPPAPHATVAVWLERAAASEIEGRRSYVEAMLRGETSVLVSMDEDEQTPTSPRLR